MKTYVITVQETLKRAILVNAESKEEAISAVQQKYRDQKIILDNDDFQLPAAFKNESQNYNDDIRRYLPKLEDYND